MTRTDASISTFILSSFHENAYVVSRVGAADCVVIDPGLFPCPLIESLEDNGLTPQAFLVTHGHLDHIGGLGEMKSRWPDAPIFVGENDRDKLMDPEGNLSAHFGFPMKTREADRTVRDGEVFEIANLTFQAIELPGHSRGHIAYVLQTEDVPIVFCGDVVFSGSIGRTDFPDGNIETLISSINDKLFALPDATILYPGHGESTTIGNEKQSNPFLQKSFLQRLGN